MSGQPANNEHLLRTISECGLFTGLSEQQCVEIAQKCETVKADQGKLLMVHGDRTTDVYFLVSGSVIGQLIAENGREILFTEIAHGGYFGELAALDGLPRSITISANTPCVLAKISRSEFLGTLHAFPQVAINLATNLGSRLRDMNERVFGLVVHDVETRVRIRLMQLAQTQEQLVDGGIITDTPTHEGMANFVGSNREAVSRAFARLTKSGAIATARKQVEIKNVSQLLSSSH